MDEKINPRDGVDRGINYMGYFSHCIGDNK